VTEYDSPEVDFPEDIERIERVINDFVKSQNSTIN
jgi:hypothetical protein